MADQPPLKNAAFILYTGLVQQADTKLLKANPTLATGDFKVSIDGGAFANLATLPTVTPAGGTAVKISLSAGEMNGDNIVVTCIDASGAEWCDQLIEIQTASVRQLKDLAYPATTGRSMVVDASGLVDANAVKVGPTGSGTAQTAGDIIGDTNDLQARLPAALTGDGNIKADTLRIGGTLQTARDIGASVLVGDKTGFSLSAAGVQALWDALTSALSTVGSIGRLLVDNLNATISSRLASASYTTPLDAAGTRAAVGLVSANLDTQLDALPTANENADALLDRSAGVETGLTPRQALRLGAAADAGKVSGAGTATVILRNAVADSKARITATCDEDGNRTAVTTDVT